MKELRALGVCVLVLMLVSACGMRKEEGSGVTAEVDETVRKPIASEAPAEDTTARAEEPPDDAEVIELRDDDGTLLVSVSLQKLDYDGAKEITRYYNDLYRSEKQWWSGELLEFAKENRQSAEEYGGRFQPFSLDEQAEIAFENRSLLAVRREYDIFTGGAHGSHTVSCDNFRLDNGKKLALGDLFYTEEYRAVLIDEVSRQIEKQLEREGALFFGDWPELIESTFDEEAFLLGRDALTVVYQLYDIAPFAAGIQSFEISYEALENHLKIEYLELIRGKE